MDRDKENLELPSGDSLTCAVIIGVSRYESSIIPDLRFSDRDARAFAALLRENGVEDIAEFINEEATRKNILDYIGKDILLKFQTVTGSKRLIVFFSGHGDRRKVVGELPRSILLTYDTEAANIIFSGISLQDLVGAVSRVEPDEVFLFVDACAVQFDQVPNIFASDATETEVFAHTKAKCLLAYIASAGKAAFENENLQAGCFTECLIRNIRAVQERGGNISDLIANIYDEVKLSGIQNPQYCATGNASLWIFDGKHRAHPKMGGAVPVRKLYIERTSVFSSLLHVIENVGSPVFIYGESGAGKSTFARKLLAEKHDGVYLSLTDTGTATVQSVISELAYHAVDVFPSGRPMESVDATLTHYKNCAPDSLIILDHTERNQTLTQELFEKFSAFSLRVVLVGKEVSIPTSKCCAWECPKLSLDEVTRFMDGQGRCLEGKPEEVLRQCEGLPIRLIELAGRHTGGNDENSRRCVDALSATGGFVSESIFRTTFSIKAETLERFILSGKVSMVEDRFLPHDSIINENHLIDVDSVFRYWEQQVTMTPSHSWACRQLVLTILREGTICSLHDRDSKAVSHAISKLVESKEWPLLKQLLGRLACHYPRQRDALLLLAKIFVHRSNNVVVEEAMAVLDEQKLTTEQKNLKAMIEAERLWWTGCYEEAKAICQKQLCQNISNSLRYECRMHMGVADFFLGNWADALDSFSFANDIFNQADPQVNAWALYLSATIVGLRGTDIRKGKEWFYMGIRLLEQIGDDSGAASAWGNLAEMNWKLRNYEAAFMQAERGYQIAWQTDHIIDQIEITRNILHICLRLYSPFDSRVETVRARLESLLQDDIGDTVDMQVWNTFATLYAYRGDAVRLRKMIDMAWPHTQNNKEYHIYTLANLCLADILEGKPTEAVMHYMEAREKALDGGNILAVRQINDDITYLNKHFCSADSETVFSQIQQFVDEIEKIVEEQMKEAS